jgi:hypothetical protein
MEITNEMIKKLKNNERPLFVLKRDDPEMVDAFENLKGNLERRVDNTWELFNRPIGQYVDSLIVRLRPDYELPKKEPKFVEYPITINNLMTLGYRCVVTHIYNSEVPLHKLPSIVGFAGVQFEGQNDNKLWNIELSMFINEEGGICSICMDGEHKPATPIKARFLVEEKE